MAKRSPLHDRDAPRISVVIATYNRPQLLQRLLENLDSQTLPADAYEVVVVDDGSAPPARESVRHISPSYQLRQMRQENAGQAVARNRGVEEARGDIIVIVDDDMGVPPGFLKAHLDAHDAGAEVVLGQIGPSPEITRMPLYERFHANMLARFVDSVSSGAQKVQGVDVCTGNVSFRRELYHRVGGFDPSLRKSEDRELGIRFEKAGAVLSFAPEAVTTHHSDHADLGYWLDTGVWYGQWDLRIARKHPDLPSADPWRFFFLVNPLSRPIIAVTVVLPGPARLLSRGLMHLAGLLDAAGAERAAIQGTTLVYGVEYFRGLRQESGSLREAIRGLRRFRAVQREAEDMGSSRGVRGALRTLGRAVRADYEATRHYRAKYNRDEISAGDLPKNLVQKIGLQMAAAIRVMGCAKEMQLPLAPKIMSRLIRHLYGAEIHWDAEFAPGLFIIHGNGLVISHAATVGERCILFHNVTLGEGRDPQTGEVGGPTLEDEVHVGPGATLIGPITVGRGSKIMAGAVLAESVPPGSLVRPAPAEVEARSTRAGGDPRSAA